MGQKMYNVTIQGITKQYPEKIPYSEIVKEYEGSTDAPVMLVIVNGRRENCISISRQTVRLNL